MKQVNDTVKKETTYIAMCLLIGSLLLQAVFLLVGKWDYKVLCGNLLSGFASILNFFLMGLTVQKAVEKDEKAAASYIRTSQTLRLFMMFVFLAVGLLLPCFNIWAVVIPLFFPRVAIAFRPLLDKSRKDKNDP